jgi:hypothetical protein
MPLEILMMVFGALCCAFMGWAVLYLSTKIDGRSATGKAARR